MRARKQNITLMQAAAALLIYILHNLIKLVKHFYPLINFI